MKKQHTLSLCLLVLCLLPLRSSAQETPSSAPSSEPAATSTSIPAASCGDGALASGETCDDGNTLDGDGCSSLCQSSDKKEKSPAAALGLAVGASAASVGLLIAGGALSEKNETASLAVVLSGLGLLVVAPSAGHFYAGDAHHGWLFSGIRLGTATVTGVGFGLALTSVLGESTPLSKAGGAMFVLGGLGSVGLLVYEVIDAPRAAKRMNTSTKEKVSLSVAPTFGASRGARSLSTGLSLQLRF